MSLDKIDTLLTRIEHKFDSLDETVDQLCELTDLYRDALVLAVELEPQLRQHPDIRILVGPLPEEKEGSSGP